MALVEGSLSLLMKSTLYCYKKMIGKGSMQGNVVAEAGLNAVMETAFSLIHSRLLLSLDLNPKLYFLCIIHVICTSVPDWPEVLNSPRCWYVSAVALGSFEIDGIIATIKRLKYRYL